MAVEDQPEGKAGNSEMSLAHDARWLLVQRITESSGFERAPQLRKILLYVSQSAILDPTRPVREYDIACEALDRRKDFDPASDNIVRSQFSNLRRKLELYFGHEGKAEPLVLKIPKGSYLPVFLSECQQQPDTPVDLSPTVHVNEKQEEVSPVARIETPKRPGWARRDSLLAAVCLFPAAVMAVFLLYNRGPATGSREAFRSSDNAFVRLMALWEGDTTVIAPDSSLVLVEVELKVGSVPLSEYASGQYPAHELEPIKDPVTRGMLAGTAGMRNTTFNEAMIASDFVSTLRRLGLNAKPRYARDLRVSDLNEGNTVVIGGASSDPWMSLFVDKMNFRFVELPQQSRYYFLNSNPAPGEQPTYTVTYSDQGTGAEGYVDVGLTQNPSHTGYVLLINASDEQEAESAANLLLRGKLPPEISSLLARKDLRYFEFFFRGKHIAGQADDSLELIACRPS